MDESRYDHVRRDYTELANERLKKASHFDGLPLIASDSKINGGIYIGPSTREAIIVDDQKDLALSQVYQFLMNRVNTLVNAKKGNFKTVVLAEVYTLVRQQMPFSFEKVADKSLGPDEKVYLSQFFDGGVCRHQALLAGYLLERLTNETDPDRRLGGKVSVDRNYIPKENAGHAWARYTNSAGTVFILDAAKEYFGPLKAVIHDKSHWPYARQEDLFQK